MGPDRPVCDFREISLRTIDFAHQAPHIALGDTTVLEEGMMFSNEPGLYSLEDGFGYNHSNNIVITATGARRMNNAPLTKEFCWIT